MTRTTVRPSLAVEQFPIDDLRPDPANPRRISGEELDALVHRLRAHESIRRELVVRRPPLAGQLVRNALSPTAGDRDVAELVRKP